MIALIIIAAIYFVANILIVLEHNQSEPIYKSKNFFFGVLFNLWLLLIGMAGLLFVTVSEYLHEKANQKWQTKKKEKIL